MHELRQLKNSRTAFTQRPGKIWAPTHLVSSASPRHPCQRPASQRANLHLNCAGWAESCHHKTGDGKVSSRDSDDSKQSPASNKVPPYAFKPESQRKSSCCV